MIPKIIWQTYELDYDDLRHDYKMASLTWKNLNPDWEYRYCSAEQRKIHIKEYSPNFYNYYKKLAPISQADIWRLCVLYSYGGFYTDMDSVCTIPLNDVFKNKTNSNIFMLMPQLSNGSYINGSMASSEKSNTTKAIANSLILETKNLLKPYDTNFKIKYNIISNVIEKYSRHIDFSLSSPFHKGHEEDKYIYNSNFMVKINNTISTYSNLAKQNNWIF
jgi:mannosyltransferase OCH1-like enzyme